MRINGPFSNATLWRMGEATRQAIQLHLSSSSDIAILQKVRGASWDVFHDPTLGTFDKIRIVRDALTHSPDPMIMVRSMIF